MSFNYDMVVIGSGPAGQKAAIQAAKLGKRAAIIDLNPKIGGVCLHDGTIPSKSFREAILHLSGYRLWTQFGQSYRVKNDIEMEDLTRWSASIVASAEQTLRAQLLRNRIQIICGWASLEDAHTVVVQRGSVRESITTEFIVIATGTSPRRPEGFEFDDSVIVDSNGILGLERLPRSLGIVGGGVIGSEYASMFSALGVEVIIVEARPAILGFIDQDIRECLVHSLRQWGASILTGEKVAQCRRASDGRAVIILESGKRLVTDVLLVSAGRSGNTASLNLAPLGIELTAEGMVGVDNNFQTTVPNIYAVGDVCGRSGLASTAIEHGRRAACHAFAVDDTFPDLPIPYGIYSIPEISMVGKTETELTRDKIPYEIGTCRFSELEKGRILGNTDGFLKILFNPNSLEILGVHAIGEGATEIIHTGQTAIAVGAKLDLLVHLVFNYPSLSQAYKIAALDGFNKVLSTRGISF
jgi:NAD(P) transhydrogenase